MVSQQMMTVACWSLLLGFRVKEMLEDDVPPGNEVNGDTVINSERTRDLFQLNVADETKVLIDAVLGCVSDLYPHLLTKVNTSGGIMFVRSMT